MTKAIKEPMRKGLLIVALLGSIFCIFVLASYEDGMEDKAEYVEVSEKDTREMQEAISGAYATMSTLGAFVSSDGTTASLSDLEIDALVKSYNEKVNRYYAKEAVEYTEYKAMNEEYLRYSFKNPVEIYNRIDGGVKSCDINSIRMDASGEKATIDANLIKWSISVSAYPASESTGQDEMIYIVTPSIGKFHIVNQVVKEDGVWKVLQTDEYTLIESGYDNDLRDRTLADYDIDKNVTMTTDDGHVCKISNAEVETIFEGLSASKDFTIREATIAIQENLDVYETEFSSFEQALKVANSLDVLSGNYFTLGEVLSK